MSWCQQGTFSIHYKEDHDSQNMGDYLMYSTPDDKTIARILHLPTAKNKLLLEKDEHRVWHHNAEYIIDNRMVYARSVRILICIYMLSKTRPQEMVEGHFMPSIPGGLAQIKSMQQHQNLRYLYRYQHMMVKRGHEIGRSVLPAMSITILSLES